MRAYDTIIVDIDGCIAIALPPPGRKIDWNKTEEAERIMAAHPPLLELILVVQTMRNAGYNVIMLTARPEKFRVCTVDYLKQHRVPCGDLLMRLDEDGHLSDADLKLKMYKKILGFGYRVLFVIEDRRPVVEMWRREGLLCLQPQDCD